MNRTRGWCFTIWEDEFDMGIKLLKTADYAIWGSETCPTTNKQHLQAYGYWTNKISFNTLKKWVTKTHITVAKGTSEQNRAYCSKDGNFTEIGTMPKQGRRTDIAEFRDAILAGMTEEELIMEFPNEMARFDRFYQRCRNIVLKKEAKLMNEVEVVVIEGKPGIGKTKYVYDSENIDDVYKLETGDGSDKSLFWDGYNGEPVILIDDFNDNFKIDYMLRLLDRYPMKLNIKGGYTWKTAKRIYITCNTPVKNWYPYESNDHREGIFRRITKIHQVKSCQTTQHSK